jgi:putative SOS response-associated peptidase YedK
MPVILTTEAKIEQWMIAPAEEALRLQRPLPDGALEFSRFDFAGIFDHSVGEVSSDADDFLRESAGPKTQPGTVLIPDCSGRRD